jgi:hypothetical protein
MIAIVLVAVLMALPAAAGIAVIALCIACACFIGAEWLVFRGHLRVAGLGFLFFAVTANVLFAAACMAPDIYTQILLFYMWLFVVLPAIMAIGLARCRLLARDGLVPQPFEAAAWISVGVLAFLPLFTLLTFWPLRLGFVTGRLALEHLADQVATGQTIAYPQQLGLLRIAGSAVDPVSGNVGLLIDPNPNGYPGFVRVRPGTPANVRGPIIGSDLNVDLGSGWSYRGDD